MSHLLEQGRSISHDLARQELEKQLQTNFWFSPDIGITQELIVEAQQIAEISIVLPPDLALITDYPHFFPLLSAHTRSRYAQTGLEVLSGTGQDISKSIVEDEYEYGKIRKTATTRVANFSFRPIFLSEGTKFFNLYYWSGNYLTGSSLTDLLGKEIAIEGKEEKDWSWYYPNSSKNPEDIEGIEFTLDPKSRRWIPPNGDEPIEISDRSTINHNRQEVDKYLKQPIRITPKKILWIGETSARLFLNPRVHGVLDSFVKEGYGSLLETAVNYQTNSLVFQGGNTHGTIRTEIVSPTTEDLIPKKVVMRITLTK